MQITPASSSGQEWVRLEDHTVIARRTLRLVRALLREALENPTFLGPDRSSWPLVDIPELDAVGGVVRLNDPKGEPIVVARVGRSSYAAFRLGADAREVERVPVEYNEETRRLRMA